MNKSWQVRNFFKYSNSVVVQQNGLPAVSAQRS